MNFATEKQLTTQAHDLIKNRLDLFPKRDAIRLSHHHLLDQLTIDTYAGYLLLTDYQSRSTEQLTLIAKIMLAALNHYDLPARGAVAKQRPDNLSHAIKQNATSSKPIYLVGEQSPKWFDINEYGRKYRISFTEGGYATGLFLDMVSGRTLVQKLAAKHQRILNLFSYTGGFSIAAALGGAMQVIEADTSKKWLTWANKNQKLNQVTIVRQRCDDALKILAKQKDNSFDMILCDPPSYAKPKRGKRFTIESGYKQMANHFGRVLDDHGVLIACCNHEQTSPRQFQQWLPDNMTFKNWIKPEKDFANADYLKIAVLEKP